MADLGVNCDIALFHQEIANGEPQGFLLAPHKPRGTGVQVLRHAYRQGDGTFLESEVVRFTVLLGDRLANPDGSPRSATFTDEYARLMDLLQKRQNLGVITPVGVISGLYAGGAFALEEHMGHSASVFIQLTTEGELFAPADRDRYEQSCWQDETSYTGSQTWENSYWRN